MPTKKKPHHYVDSIAFDPMKQWKLAEQELNKMSKKEILQTFVKAGILTEKGNLKKFYKDVFVEAPSTKKANAS